MPFEITIWFDDLINSTHIAKHDVSYAEIEAFFSKNTVRYKVQRKDKSFKAIGQLPSGRYLEVIYRQISQNELYIITAYDIADKEIRNFLDAEENQ